MNLYFNDTTFILTKLLLDDGSFVESKFKTLFDIDIRNLVSEASSLQIWNRILRNALCSRFKHARRHVTFCRMDLRCKIIIQIM